MSNHQVIPTQTEAVASTGCKASSSKPSFQAHPLGCPCMFCKFKTQGVNR